MAATEHLLVFQRADYRHAWQPLSVVNEQGEYVPEDFVGWSVAAQVRPDHSSEEVLFDFGLYLTLGNDGWITLNIPAVVTKTMGWRGAARWDLELTDPEGVVERLLEGTVRVSPEVTR